MQSFVSGSFWAALLTLCLILATGCTVSTGAEAEGETDEGPVRAAAAVEPVGAPDTDAAGGSPPGDAPRPAGASGDTGPAATKPFAFEGADAQQDVPAACRLDGFAMPEDARVYAAGAYSGARADFQIDQSGHQATTMQVAVNQPDAPVVLLLGAYEPAVWSVGWTSGTRIAAVVVTGYHRQRVTGLPASIPTLVSTYQDRGPCGYAYVGGEGMRQLNPLARQVFGRPVDMAFTARDGQVLVGEPLAGASLQTDAAAVAPAEFRLKDAPLAGQAGLDAALRAGVLRPATQVDVLAWEAASSRHGAAEDVPPVQGAARPRVSSVPHRAYTVLKAFQIPAGLYGAHSATFYVAPGVPSPTGNPGHSSVRDIDTGTCAGATCGMH
ncbi:hypothetical protein H0E84_00900 [Luteimonas sp. SJ-92]|uniref:Uncharacterized protein n=1 Tax=Luteimonas salinisoli TaxID=2752307 RepID=A0A853J792_9GAMM|nr:hypothetical protein [Luteimonas salinisoli]NZA24933.1 hypothetical protein [Luteimonas salinisoli]